MKDHTYLQQIHQSDTARYAKCIRWEIEMGIFKGRNFDFGKKLLPNDLLQAQETALKPEDVKRLLSQIQGRTYANIFGLVERFICAKIMEVSDHYMFGGQVALETQCVTVTKS